MPSFAPLAEVETPHKTAKQTWDNRLGKAWREGHYWMWAFAIMLGLNIWQYYTHQRLEQRRIARPIEIFYVAMSEDGIGKVLGKAPLQATPTKAALEARVRRFVLLSRGKSLDPVVVQAAWKEQLYQWVTPRGTTLLNEWAREREAVLRSPKVSISVMIDRVLVQSDQTYDVWWTETRRDHNNNKEDVSRWSGNYTVKIDKPKDEKQLMANETGVFIDFFATTRAK
jgi:type IV secretory pathway TrbF-like protein